MGTLDRQCANVNKFATALAAMLREPLSAEEVARRCKLHPNTAHKMVNAMHGRCLFIKEWAADPRGAYTIARYKVGKKADAPRPGPRATRIASVFELGVAIDQGVEKLRAKPKSTP